MSYYTATIEILVEAADEAEACDVINETLRPVLRSFELTSSVIDWRFSAGNDYPTPDTGAGFECAEAANG